MSVDEYVDDVVKSYGIDVKEVNHKTSLKETLNQTETYILKNLWDGLFDDVHKKFTEKDLMEYGLDIVRTIIKICEKRGRF